jgi:hypothetical protein
MIFLLDAALGFVLNTPAQHGHLSPFQSVKISHAVHRFCPTPYLVCGLGGFGTLYRKQIPLHDIVK